MVIKPGGVAYFGAALLTLSVGVVGSVCILIAIRHQYDYFWFCVVPLFTFLLFFASRNLCLICKTIELCQEGYWVSFFGFRKLYRWETVKIKRIEDCTEVLGRRNRSLYPECLYISVHKIQRPKWCNPVEFCVFTHPFSSIYACFKPEKEGAAVLLGTIECIVIDKQELLDSLRSFGVELEGQGDGKTAGQGDGLREP